MRLFVFFFLEAHVWEDIYFSNTKRPTGRTKQLINNKPPWRMCTSIFSAERSRWKFPTAFDDTRCMLSI